MGDSREIGERSVLARSRASGEAKRRPESKGVLSNRLATNPARPCRRLGGCSEAKTPGGEGVVDSSRRGC